MKEELLHHIVHASDDFIAVIDLDFSIVLANDAYLSAFDRPKEEIIGRDFFDIWPGEGCDPEEERLRILGCLKEDRVLLIQSEQIGERHFRFRKAFYPFGRQREATHIIAVFHDISDLDAIESRLTHYEFRDHVTGLFNRRSLEIILEMELEKARRSREENLRALLFISVTNLGAVNDSIGFDTGDLLLESIGCRIRETLRKSDYVFRFEGNELAVLLTSVTRITDVAQVADKLEEIISLPYHTGSTTIHLSSAIGISTCPEDGKSVEELIQHASAARREAKRQGEKFMHWNPVLHARATERLKMKGELARAFNREEFRLLYQPIVDAGGAIQGVETLIRWRHPERGVLAPSAFISLLEENRSINTLTRWVLLQAADQLVPIAREYGTFFSINLSSFDLLDPDFIEVVGKVVSDHASTLRLHLELGGITRRYEIARSREAMERLTALGARLILSDFAGEGTVGGLLRELPVEGVKIEIAALESADPEGAEMTLAADLATLARHQGKKIFLEGIESRDACSAVEGIGADYRQGFYFSEPVPIAVLQEILKAGGKLPQR